MSRSPRENRETQCSRADAAMKELGKISTGENGTSPNLHATASPLTKRSSASPEVSGPVIKIRLVPRWDEIGRVRDISTSFCTTVKK